ncbi:MAG: hypothetical protein IT385_29795 [Deltaproteobacteria bacterium]|nr:hypothetical protein [Deltaproteobacteria bacterium]
MRSNAPFPIVVALACALVATAEACGGDTHAPGDPLRTIPPNAEVVIVAPSVTKVQAAATAFLDGLPGAPGVLDLLAERYGLDLRTPEGVASLGIDPARAATVWTREGTIIVAVAVRDARVFGAHVEQRLVRGAGGARVPGSPEAWEAPRVVDGPPPPGSADGRPLWRAGWSVTPDGIGLLALTGGDGDPAAQCVTATRDVHHFGDEPAGPYAKAREVGGQDALLYMIVGDILPPTPGGLGLLQGFVDNVRKGLGRWYGGVALSGERVALRLASDFSGEGELPVSWVALPGGADVIARVLPKTTSALMRFRINLGKLRALPGFIVSQFLPDQIPGFEALPIPALPDLVDLLEGDVGVAFLGLDPKATFGHLTSLRALRERALETFRVALVARLRDAEGARRQFAGIADQLSQSGWVVAPLQVAQAGGWTGWTFVRGATSYSVLIDPEVIVFIVGPGEVDAFIAARAGRATTLAQYGAGFDATLQEALGLSPAGGATALGISLGFLRVTRELADKGVPPFFLKMLSRIKLVGLSLDAQPKRVTIGLEVAR